MFLFSAINLSIINDFYESIRPVCSEWASKLHMKQTKILRKINLRLTATVNPLKKFPGNSQRALVFYSTGYFRTAVDGEVESPY